MEEPVAWLATGFLDLDYLRLAPAHPCVMTDLEEAWAELDAANAGLRWEIGRPSLHDDVSGAEHWEQWAHDPRETPKIGRRSREWTATAPTVIDCVRERARCLGEISAGRVPRLNQNLRASRG
jgi:hypothetical protein